MDTTADPETRVTIQYYEGESPKNGKRYVMAELFVDGKPIKASTLNGCKWLTSRFDTPENREALKRDIEGLRERYIKEILNNE